MARCPSCGGIINRDCFNPVECAAITESQNQEQGYAEGYRQAEIDMQLQNQLQNLEPMTPIQKAKEIAKVLYWVPYVPIIGFFMSVLNNGRTELCIYDCGKHFYISATIHVISTIILLFIL